MKKNIITQFQMEQSSAFNLDDRFVRMKVWIANVGENYNNSAFSEDALAKMASTLPYVPVVGYIGKNKFSEVDFRGHEEELKYIGNDEYEFEYLGFAYGFVPFDCNAKFETKECPDGVTRTYLTCEALIWTKWKKACGIFSSSDWIKSQSMEITDIKGDFGDDNVFHIEDARFDALCVLGEDVSPGIPFSTIEKFSVTNLKAQIKEMLDQYTIYSTDKYKIPQKVKDNAKLGLTFTNKLNKIDAAMIASARRIVEEDQVNDEFLNKLKQYQSNCMSLKDENDRNIYGLLLGGASVDDWSLMSLNPVSAKVNDINDIKEEKHEFEMILFSGKEEEQLKKSEIAAKFSLTTNQMYAELDRVLRECKYETENWAGEKVEREKYWLNDYDESFVYVTDRSAQYKDMKIPYSMNGDNPVMEYENAKRIKYVAMDWEEGEKEDDDDEEDEMKFAIVLENEAKQEYQKAKEVIAEKSDSLIALTEKYSVVENELKEAKEKLEQYSSLEAERLTKEKEEKAAGLIAEFSKKIVMNSEEVESYKEKAKNYSKYEDFAVAFKAEMTDKILASVASGTAQFSNMSIDAQLPREKNQKQSYDGNDPFEKLKQNYSK